MEQKSKNAVSIIGGADGSTSFFIVGHSKKQPLKIRIKNSIYRYKCQKERLILIARDLYSYYGVTEEDIRNKTKRYSSLVTNLSS